MRLAGGALLLWALGDPGLVGLQGRVSGGRGAGRSAAPGAEPEPECAPSAGGYDLAALPRPRPLSETHCPEGGREAFNPAARPAGSGTKRGQEACCSLNLSGLRAAGRGLAGRPKSPSSPLPLDVVVRGQG